MSGTEEQAAEPPVPEAPTKDFLKQAVRGIPREKMKEKKVYYGFKYKDLKTFIDSLVARYKDLKNPELVAKLSELEMKLQTLAQQRDRLKEELEAARGEAGADPAELADLKAQLEALEQEKAAFEARVAELEDQSASTADENAKRAADLSAELAALKETHAKLEEESEFLDAEMGKLDARNKELEEKLQALQAELDALKAGREADGQAFEKEREGFRTRMAELEELVAASKDAQKLLELQKRYEMYADLLKAYEAGAAEAFDIERMPDAEAVAGRIEEIRGRAGEGTPAAAALAELESKWNGSRESMDALLETMYGDEGSFRVVLELGKTISRVQQLAERARVLADVTAG